MNTPLNLDSGSVQALLARLRAAQGTGGNPEASTQNGGSRYQYPVSAGYGQQNGIPPSSGYAPYSAPPTTYGDQSISLPAEGGLPETPSRSVRSLLSSLQNVQPRSGYTVPSVNSATSYTASRHTPPIPSYQQPASTSARPQYTASRYDRSFHGDMQDNRAPEPAFPSGYSRPTRKDHQPPQTQHRTSNEAVNHPQTNLVTEDPVPPTLSPDQSPTPPRTRQPILIPQNTVATKYDPYDEDFEPPEETGPDDAADSDTPDAAARMEEEDQAREKAQVEADEKERASREKEERNADEFVNMSFGRASVVVTQLLSKDSVMQRLRELKEEQDKMERQLWQKRLDIVKTHREKMNKAKEEATRLDSRAGEARIVKEKAAANRALKQFYTSRCLPFYDDLHRKHLKIMQEELGIPGLGRLETRVKKTPAHTGGSERPITIDSDEDDEDDVEEQEVFDAVVGAVAEEEREKMLARRRKIMGLIESIMADASDD